MSSQAELSPPRIAYNAFVYEPEHRSSENDLVRPRRSFPVGNTMETEGRHSSKFTKILRPMFRHYCFRYGTVPLFPVRSTRFCTSRTGQPPPMWNHVRSHRTSRRKPYAEKKQIGKRFGAALRLAHCLVRVRCACTHRVPECTIRPSATCSGTKARGENEFAFYGVSSLRNIHYKLFQFASGTEMLRPTRNLS
ncbi:hypothetical protein BIW11_03197 [Tropilaelaps mercedesae]|uniref:Uncharacterized protein n=1 Tax=Tropilaelaps mercedesae TaxID=418985 RepID=A0A1V9XQH9_9ACAR|nr:hypothetical protein BIW11_03197 [Tropilaelaps mercedesae]